MSLRWGAACPVPSQVLPAFARYCTGFGEMKIIQGERKPCTGQQANDD